MADHRLELVAAVEVGLLGAVVGPVGFGLFDQGANSHLQIATLDMYSAGLTGAVFTVGGGGGAFGAPGGGGGGGAAAADGTFGGAGHGRMIRMCTSPIEKDLFLDDRITFAGMERCQNVIQTNAVCEVHVPGGGAGGGGGGPEAATD